MVLGIPDNFNYLFNFYYYYFTFQNNSHVKIRKNKINTFLKILSFISNIISEFEISIYKT